jgi:fatty-acyl-CoA synthase
MVISTPTNGAAILVETMAASQSGGGLAPTCVAKACFRDAAFVLLPSSFLTGSARAAYRRVSMISIGARIDELALRYGDRPALFSAERCVSFRELGREANRVAKALGRIGVSKGTRVGILMPNRPEWLACAFGALQLGAIVVPLNTLHRRAELEHSLRHADVTVLITVSHFLKHAYVDLLREICPGLDAMQRPLALPALPALREVVVVGEAEPHPVHGFDTLCTAGERSADEWVQAAQAQVVPTDPAAIFFTSGTTAAPKGVVHSHATMLTAAHNVADRLGLTADDRTWGYLPFFFTGGLVAVGLATLSRGGAVLLQEVFDAGAALQLMEQHGCTTFFAWPHQAEALVAHPNFAGTKLRLRKGPGAQTGWAAQLLQPDHQAVGTWGMTETGPMAASSRWDDPLPVRAGSHGRPMPGLEFHIADPATGQSLAVDQEGELLVRGTSLMLHYYKMAPADCFDANGFFHTGDLARLDATGHLHFLGRIKDVIKTAGANVAAAEVEALLQTHPAVKVAYVVGVPHPARGENVAAFVVRRDERCDASELVAYCRERLASYKVPRHIFLCSEADLPVLGSGKVDKQALRARAAAHAGGTP